MADLFEYTLSLNDKISANLQKIGFNSELALEKFGNLQKSVQKTDKLMDAMGGSVGALRERLNILRQERDWIPQKNINEIRKYNSEIKKLEKQIHKLENINGSKIKTWTKDAFSDIPGVDMINPVTAVGAALAKSGSMSLSFSEGMAKINTTAELSTKELDNLKNSLLEIGTDAGADLATVPDAFEKILSQTGDTALSQDILKASLKGSKAGFTETSVVSAALAQSLSLIGKENANAQEVLDTFFAAKRVGAGEFKDFANYMPGLIASGQALGKGFKETAGVFSYMTGKGQSAERAAVLMENAFSAFGKKDITSKLEKVEIDVVQKDGSIKKKKIEVFDKNGSMRRMDEIFAELHTKLESFGKNDKAKSNFLEKIGLKDKEARQAFMILASDAGKLKSTINEVTDSMGETDQAFKNAQNPLFKIQQLWSRIQKAMISVGDTLAVVLEPAFDGLMSVLKPVLKLTSLLFGELKNNKTLLLILASGVTAYAVATNAAAIKNKILTVSQWSLNAALDANPVGAVVLAITALVGIVTLAIQKYDEWGAALTFLVSPLFLIINGIMAFRKHWDSIVKSFQEGGFIKGVVRIGEVLLDALLVPIQQLLELIAKIPGLEDLAGGGANWIKEQRVKLKLLEPEKKGFSPSDWVKKIAGLDNITRLRELSEKPKGIKPINPFTLNNDNNNKSAFKQNIEGVNGDNGKSTNITVKFDKLVENITIKSETIKEGADEMVELVERALLRIINSANAMGN